MYGKEYNISPSCKKYSNFVCDFELLYGEPISLKESER